MNVVLIGFNSDGGFRYTVDSRKLEEFLRVSFPSHRPSCLETGQPLDIEHHVVFNVFPVSFLNLSLRHRLVDVSLKSMLRCISATMLLLCNNVSDQDGT